MTPSQHAKVLEAAEFPSLYEKTGDIKDINTMLVPRAALSIMRAVQVGAPDDLRDRCAGIIEWQETGILKGEKLREFASKQRWADDPHVLMIAESETAREAFKLLAATPPTEPEVKHADQA